VKRTINEDNHDHTFGQERKKAGEKRTLIVITIAGCMMIVEITTGLLFGSMALLADGLHMTTHTLALTVSAIAYIYARRHADDPSFSYGTGKVNSLAGFASAILLAIFTAFMLWESVKRLIDPVAIEFNRSIAVACAGLVVNLVSI
jgi:cation diffusion facilitator family transporter